MSNYTKTTNFAAKDSLPSGNAAKIVKGAEIDTEFNNIATASATKANANNAALTGTTVFETLSDGTIGVTGWVDEDNMSSDSAVLIPTQQSVKAYVDSQVTAQDLDVTDGSTSIDIDLDSESLGILGGTGITSSASGTGVTLAIDSTVTTLTGTQTLSNKTLTTPVISGALTTNSTIDGRDVATDGSKLDGIESGATADQTAAQIKTAYESNADTNAFTDADESKLDGIEASADVTDTTNVTAAGALMDSELTSIASVKAMNQGVATTDSPTFAGVTAPITGNVTGNLTGNVTGNVTGDLTGDVTGNVAGNLTGSVLTAAQTNITSVGTLGSLDVSGNLTAGTSQFFGTSVLTVDSTNNRVGLSNASPDVSLDIGSNTDAVHVPTGTTAQRPTGAAGMFRYNSSLEQFEGYTSEWGSIGGGGGTNTFTTDSFTGNGSTTAYALSQVTSSEDNLLVFIEGVFQQQDAYSIATASGTTTLTFSAAPANGNAILIYSVASAVSGSNLNIDSMTGDGSDTTLTLSIAPVNENNTQVFIDGVYQSKSNYSISGTTLTFSTAPPTGTAVEVMTFTQTDINVPVDGTITSAKLSGALTTPSDLTVTGAFTSLGIDDNATSTAITIDSSENVLVGKTALTIANEGVVFEKGGAAEFTTDAARVMRLNRTSSDGSVLEINKDGTAVGIIGCYSGDLTIGNASTVGLIFEQTGSDRISPWNLSTNATRDGEIDLGDSNQRFKDIYLSGTMIGDLVKLRQHADSMYVSPTTSNTLNGNYDENSDSGDMWINYRGYQDGFSRFRDFRVGNGKGSVILLVDGSAASVAITGSLSVSSSLSKGSGSFKIDHPLPAKAATHHLVHSFIEGPQADNIYRGKIDLVDGSATVNIDTAAGMTEGTYVLLNTNTQCFTSNESGWTAVKGSVSGNTLTITAQESCTDTISWMVIGERQDQHMLDTEWTDENGKVIVEPSKELEEIPTALENN